jgi:hypothetical protein
MRSVIRSFALIARLVPLTRAALAADAPDAIAPLNYIHLYVDSGLLVLVEQTALT